MATIKTDALRGLNLPAMRQLGIVVKSIDESLPFYSKVLNINPWYKAKVVETEIFYKDKLIDLELDIVIGYSGSLQFELIEITKDTEEHIYSDLVATQGEGLHHIGFTVSNIGKGIEALEKAGFKKLQYGTLKTQGMALTKFAYFDTIEHCGYITELIQVTLFGIHMGMSHFMIKLGKLLGDVDLVSIPQN